MADLTNRLLFDIRPALKATDKIEREVDSIGKKFRDSLSGKIDIDSGDVKRVRNELGQFEKIEVEVEADSSAIDRALAKVRSIRSEKVEIEVDVDDGEVKRVRNELGQFVKVEVETSAIDRALAKLRSIGSEKVEVDVDVDEGGVNGLFSSISDFASKGAVAAGLAIGTALTAGITGALDDQTAITRLQAQLGTTEEGAERLGDIAKTVFRDDFGESLTEVTDGVKIFADQFGDLGDIADEEIEGILKSALSVQDLFDVDLQESMRAAGQLVQTGLAPDFESAFDTISSGIQSGLNESDDFLDSLIEYAPNLRDLGLTLDDFNSLLGTGLAEGAFNTDLIGDAFKEFGIRVRDETPGVTEAFDTLGLKQEDFVASLEEGGPAAREATLGVLAAVQSIEDPILQNITAIELFGTKSEDLGVTVFDALDPASLQFQTIEGAAEQMADTIGGTVSSRISSFRRQALGALTDFIGDRLFPLIDRLAPVFSAAFGAISTAVAPLVTTIVGGFRAFAAAIRFADGDVTSSGFAGFMERLGNIIILVIVPAFQALIGFIGTVAGLFADFISNLDVDIFEVFGEAIEIVGEALQDVDWEGIFGTISDGIELFFEVAEPVVNWLIARLVPVFNIVAGVIAGVVRTVSALLEGDWRRAWQALQDTARNAINQVGQLISSVDWGAVLGLVWQKIRDGASAAWAAISEIVPEALNGIGRLLSSVDWAQLLETVWRALISGAQTALLGVMAAVTTGLNAAGQLISSIDWAALLQGALALLVDGVAIAFELMVAAVLAGLAAIANLFQEIEWGALLDTAWGAIQAAVGVAWELIKTAVLDALIGVGNVFLDLDWGGLLDTAWEALKTAVGVAWDGIELVVQTAIDAIPGILLGAVDALTSAGAAIGDAILAGLSAAFGAAGDIGSALINGIIDAINVGITFVNDAIPDSIAIPGLPDIDLPDNPLPNIDNFFQGGILPGSREGTIVRAAEGNMDELLLGQGSSFARQVSLLREFDDGRLFARLSNLFAGQAKPGGVTHHHYHLEVAQPPTSNARIWGKQLLAEVRRHQR